MFTVDVKQQYNQYNLSVPYPSLNKKFCNHRLAQLRFEPLTSTITNLLLLLDYSV